MADSEPESDRAWGGEGGGVGQQPGRAPALVRDGAGGGVDVVHHHRLVDDVDHLPHRRAASVNTSRQRKRRRVGGGDRGEGSDVLVAALADAVPGDVVTRRRHAGAAIHRQREPRPAQVANEEGVLLQHGEAGRQTEPRLAKEDAHCQSSEPAPPRRAEASSCVTRLKVAAMSSRLRDGNRASSGSSRWSAIRAHEERDAAGAQTILLLLTSAPLRPFQSIRNWRGWASDNRSSRCVHSVACF